MSFVDLLYQSVHAVRDSEFFETAVWITVISIITFLILGVLLLITILLRRFFRKHKGVNRAHKVLIYLFTMAGVLLLLLAGILGLLLPIIPGIPFLVAALLLMRKYHRWEWLETNIARLKARLQGNQEKVNKSPKARSSQKR